MTRTRPSPAAISFKISRLLSVEPSSTYMTSAVLPSVSRADCIFACIGRRFSSSSRTGRKSESSGLFACGFWVESICLPNDELYNLDFSGRKIQRDRSRFVDAIAVSDDLTLRSVLLFFRAFRMFRGQFLTD